MCKDTDIFRIFASYFIIDIIMPIDNTLKARVQHAVAPNESSTMIPKDGEIVFSSTLDNFKVGKNSQKYKDLNYLITDTKNTAGATDSSSKLYLIGATSQTANPQTYSQDTAYVDTDGCLYSNSKKVALDEDVESLRDLVYSIHYQPSWVVNPTLVFAGGTTTTVTATAKLSFNGTAESEFTASTPDGWTEGTTSGTTRTFTKELNATATASTKIEKDNYSKTVSATVTAVYPIYYGQSSNGSLQVLTNLTQFGTATNTAINRAYTVDMTASNYFIVAVPSSGVTKPSQVGVGGASGFFENLETIGTYTVTEPRSSASVLYTFYRTQATQTAGSKDYYLK